MKGTFYDVHVDVQDDYVWFSLNFGNSIPRDSKVTNINTGKKRNNNRAIDEAELNNQVFYLYRFSTGRLYASSRKEVFEAILKTKMQKDFTAKSLFVDVDEFMEMVKECSYIQFTSAERTWMNAMSFIISTSFVNTFRLVV